jgi:hypothetical protein
MDVATELILGLCLASATGLRAFLPMLIISVLAHFHVVHLIVQYAWMESDTTMIVLGIATVIDLLADKIPVIDHAMDVFHTIARPTAGLLLVAGTQQHLSPHLATLAGVAIGLPAAASVHVLKSGARLSSTALTGGCLTPFLSFAEDIASAVMTVLAVFAPFVALGVLIAGVWSAVRAATTLRNRARDKNGEKAVGETG